MEAREFEQLAAQTLQCLAELTGHQAEVPRERMARSTSLRDCMGSQTLQIAGFGLGADGAQSPPEPPNPGMAF